MTRHVYDAFDTERLKWASDRPHQLLVTKTCEDSMALVRDKYDFLTEADRHWVLRGAETLRGCRSRSRCSGVSTRRGALHKL
jgi:hypothetical protein